jgi:hypothetical protein
MGKIVLAPIERVGPAFLAFFLRLTVELPVIEFDVTLHVSSEMKAGEPRLELVPILTILELRDRGFPVEIPVNSTCMIICQLDILLEGFISRR